MEGALCSGAIHQQVDRVRAVREERVRKRVDTRVGISNYVQLDTPATPRDQVSDSDLPGEAVCGAMPVWRDAEVHDALRDAADRWEADHGGPPTVAVRTVGSQKDHGGRLTWVTHVLASGGVHVQIGPFSADESLSGAVVLCGSARAYDAFEGSLSEALQRAGADQVWIVGKPCSSDEGRPFFAEGLDLVTQLEQLHRELGVGG